MDITGKAKVSLLHGLEMRKLHVCGKVPKQRFDHA
jgi:hypothetical protein